MFDFHVIATHFHFVLVCLAAGPNSLRELL
jgi:hypothetical protein